MNEIDELKRLLLGQELESVKQLEDRVADPGLRAQDVAEILPDSISLGTQKDTRLISALEKPVSECLKQSIRKDTKMFADALFPVMGPAIRKAIAEALKSFSDAINQAMDQTFSAKGLRWRMESIRTGVPFSQVVLKHTLLYRVDQAFLIHRETGLLIDHAAHPDVHHEDSDAVSAMFTAIQDFVRDSFATDKESDLDSVDIGEQTVWLIHGPYAMLACVISGVAPRELRQRFKELLENLHHLYGRQLEEFDGDACELSGVEPALEECLTLQLKQDGSGEDKSKKPFPVLWVVLGAIALMLLAWWIYSYLEGRQFNKLRSEIDNTPGIVLVRADKRDGDYVFKGLRDPLAKDPKLMAVTHGFKPDEVTFDMAGYQSSEKTIVLERARRLLNVPDTVELSLDNAQLNMLGTAPQEWIDSHANTVLAIAGIDAVNFNGVTPDFSVRNQQLIDQLQVPQSVNAEVDGPAVKLVGQASWPWMTNAAGTLKSTTWVQTIDVSQLQPGEAERINQLVRKISAAKIYFPGGTVIEEDSLDTLDELSANITELSALTKKVNTTLSIKLTGHADPVGSPAANARLREARANTVLNALISRGLDSRLFTLAVGGDQAVVQDVDLLWRRVDIEVNAVQPDVRGLFAK